MAEKPDPQAPAEKPEKAAHNTGIHGWDIEKLRKENEEKKSKS